MQYSSLQHRTLLLSPVTSTVGIVFALALSLHSFWSYFSTSILGIYQSCEFIFQCPIFLPFHTVHGFSRQEYWSGLPFSSPVDHILSELSTVTHLSWVALQGMAHSFIELDKAVVMWSDWLVYYDCGFQSVFPLMEKGKRLMEASWWDRLTEGETGSCSDGL